MDAIRSANRTRAPEDSLLLRAVVLATVMMGVIALAVERAISIQTTVGVMVGLPVAYWISYVRRRSDNWFIKLALTVGAIFALIRFMGQLRGVATLDEVRFPLAELFLWVQVLHGFDLPARKDLNFSLGSSLTLVAAAASLSQDLRFGAIAIVYFALATFALALGHRSELAEGTIGATTVATRKGAPTPSRSRAGAVDIVKAVAITALAGFVLFMVIPQPTAARTFSLPFSFGGGGISAAGGIANPGFGGDAPDSRSGGPSYYGFSNRLDLRVRGDLPDTLVMRVRSSAPAMWRGMLFDTYDGTTWTGADEDEVEDFVGDPPYGYPPEFRSLGPRQTVTQTYYIEAEQPSAIFAAGQPDQVWFDGTLSVDSNGGLRTGTTLTPGTVYSVVSTRGAATAEELRALPSTIPPEQIQKYLQGVDILPERVKQLARDITKDATNDFDRVKAIEDWMAANFEYRIDSPVPLPGQDAVDHFLFETEVGFCEQFAAATTMMLRSLRIPARLVAGYTPGDRNPFTGYHEVKASDAHTWVEAWFPGFGWYEFDPTFAVPVAEVSVADTIPAMKVFRFLAEKLGGLVPDGAGGALKTGLFVALVGVLVGGALYAVKRLRPTPAVAGATQDAGALAPGAVTRAFHRLEQAWALRGAGRAPPETAGEFLGRREGRAARRALRAFEQERYGNRPLDEVEAKAAIEELHRLTDSALGNGVGLEKSETSNPPYSRKRM